MAIENVNYLPELTINLASLIKLERNVDWYSLDISNKSLKLRSPTLGTLKIFSHSMKPEPATNFCLLSAQNHPNIRQNGKGIHLFLGHLSYGNIEHPKIKTGFKIIYQCDVCDTATSTRSVSHRDFDKPHRHFFFNSCTLTYVRYQLDLLMKIRLLDCLSTIH